MMVRFTTRELPPRRVYVRKEEVAAVVDSVVFSPSANGTTVVGTTLVLRGGTVFSVEGDAGEITDMLCFPNQTYGFAAQPSKKLTTGG